LTGCKALEDVFAEEGVADPELLFVVVAIVVVVVDGFFASTSGSGVVELVAELVFFVDLDSDSDLVSELRLYKNRSNPAVAIPVNKRITCLFDS
jgi:hypothetical protein